MKLFNRKDPQVQKDAESNSEEEFIKKYSDTGATSVILKSVYQAFNKTKKRTQEIAKAHEISTDFVEATSSVSVEENEPVTEISTFKIKSKDGGGKPRVIVETDDIRPFKKGKKGQSGEKSEGKDKPGRTPRMRELLQEKQYKREKSLVKAQLEAEGFNCTGSGFHSEWNRISKAK